MLDIEDRDCCGEAKGREPEISQRGTMLRPTMYVKQPQAAGSAKNLSSGKAVEQTTANQSTLPLLYTDSDWTP